MLWGLQHLKPFDNEFVESGLGVRGLLLTQVVLQGVFFEHIDSAVNGVVFGLEVGVEHPAGEGR